MTSGDRAFEAPELIDVMDEAENYNQHLLGLVLAWSQPFERLLDFGAGSGRVAGALQRAGRRIAAVEPDPRLRARIAALGIPTHPGLAELADASVDGIYSLNVLEHIADDLAALREMRRALRPGGGLFLYVPAFPLLYSSKDRRVGHVRRYRLPVLRARLRAAGFRPDRGGYADSLGFLAAFAFRFLGNADGDLSRSAVRRYDRYVFPLSRRCDAITARFLGKNLVLTATAAPA
ncbi:MAG: class I SAM-dependent methyltransferase [Candidatus Binatia bacterium]